MLFIESPFGELPRPSVLQFDTQAYKVATDVLTLSKLDSALISVVPTEFQPSAINDEAMRMFQAEYASNNIDVETHAEEKDYMMTDYVLGDSSRVVRFPLW